MLSPVLGNVVGFCTFSVFSSLLLSGVFGGSSSAGGVISCSCSFAVKANSFSAITESALSLSISFRVIV